MWYVYIISKNHKYYTGITTDLKNRLCQHGNAPLLYKKEYEDKSAAAKHERQIKGYARLKKEQLIAKFDE